MILPIYIYGHPVLRKESQDINADYPGLKELIDNMFETLTESDGVGLAAPQVGLNIRLAVIDLDVLSEEYPEYKDFRRAYINPHIVEVDDSEVVSMEEGCLSIPGIHESVKRATRIHVKYMDATSMSTTSGLRVTWPVLCSTSLIISTQRCLSTVCRLCAVS